MYTSKLFTVLFFCTCLFHVQNIQSQDAAIIKMGFQKPGKIDVKGFELKGADTLTIQGYGGMYEKMGSDLMFYGWIIDSKTRKVVWNLIEDANDEFFTGDKGRFSFRRKVGLPAGQYEAYFTAGMNYDRFGTNYHIFTPDDLGDLIHMIVGEIHDNFDDDDMQQFSSRFYMKISGSQSLLTEIDGNKVVDEISKNALVSIVRAGNNEKFEKSFKVLEDVDVNLRGVWEIEGNEQFDYAFIVNSFTYEKVWPNAETKFKKAGGGKKNKLVNQTVHLSKGSYTLFYISDGTHSYDKWNVLPPYDPQFWGVTLSVDQANIAKVNGVESFDPFVLKLNKAGDNAYLTQGFSLKKDMKIRVYCLGESSGDAEMADYGWIVNTDNNQTVWHFSARSSQYAGGAEKNRLVNEELNLKKGNYIAYYVTDDSHSYHRWNDASPSFPELWGLNILVEKERESFTLYDAKSVKPDNLLVEIIKVRDNETVSRTFTLEKNTKVRIYAIGEGDDGDMADMGWIKDRKTSNVVWEMTYRISEYAGGAEKNRMFDGSILLPAGEYIVYFETDDSHSYHNWNETPPQDQEHYGITLYKME